jgi:hypothetical protein
MDAEEVAEDDGENSAGISVGINYRSDIGRRNKTARGRFPKTRAKCPKRCRWRFVLRVSTAGLFWGLWLSHRVLGFLHDGFVWQFFIIIHRWKFP